jgi:hypothetical protein
MNPKIRNVAGLAMMALSAMAWSAEGDKAAPVVPAAPEVAAAPAPVAGRPLVQIAILLDTSGSMGGMIKQAQTQLWAIVNEFATAKRDGQKPILQVALYQYGTPSLGVDNGYIKQLLPLTDDLDKVSEALFKLRDNGGDEYCGWVIQDAVRDLKWSPSPKDYKAIFIAGNESFAQGKVDFHESCKAAIAKGIIVNTIHCAGAEDTCWADGARLADGQFMRIDGTRTVVEVKAPQDAELAKLNGELNKTYIAYGRAGRESMLRQQAMDQSSSSLGSGVLAKRAYSKANAQYRNSDWDMVDAAKDGKLKVEEMKAEELPEEMRKMTVDERKAFVAAKEKERADVQAKIQKLAKDRDAFVAAEMKKNANTDTLGEKVQGAVREQATKQGFLFEK